jgi:pimeloyl-ACP methyl ester carboxylesterase
MKARPSLLLSIVAVMSGLLYGPAARGCGAMPVSKPVGDYVVLVHGLDCMSLSMNGMQNALKKIGYQVINEQYSSGHLSVQQAADEWLAGLLARRATNQNVKVHFVTHSMGGLVVRQYLRDHSLTNLGRVVMLAPPNHGSQLADKFQRNFLFKWFAGPAGQQLGTGMEQLPEQLGPADFEVGIIAGDRSLHPIFSSWLPGPDDGKVSVDSTKLEGMKDFLVVHHTHTWIMWKKDVIQAVSNFLASGSFSEPVPAAQPIVRSRIDSVGAPSPALAQAKAKAKTKS